MWPLEAEGGLDVRSQTSLASTETTLQAAVGVDQSLQGGHVSRPLVLQTGDDRLLVRDLHQRRVPLAGERVDLAVGGGQPVCMRADVERVPLVVEFGLHRGDRRRVVDVAGGGERDAAVRRLGHADHPSVAHSGVGLVQHGGEHAPHVGDQRLGIGNAQVGGHGRQRSHDGRVVRRAGRSRRARAERGHRVAGHHLADPVGGEQAHPGGLDEVGDLAGHAGLDAGGQGALHHLLQGDQHTADVLLDLLGGSGGGGGVDRTEVHWVSSWTLWRRNALVGFSFSREFWPNGPRKSYLPVRFHHLAVLWIWNAIIGLVSIHTITVFQIHLHVTDSSSKACAQKYST